MTNFQITKHKYFSLMFGLLVIDYYLVLGIW